MLTRTNGTGPGFRTAITGAWNSFCDNGLTRVRRRLFAAADCVGRVEAIKVLWYSSIACHETCLLTCLYDLQVQS